MRDRERFRNLLTKKAFPLAEITGISSDPRGDASFTPCFDGAFSFLQFAGKCLDPTIDPNIAARTALAGAVGRSWLTQVLHGLPTVSISRHPARILPDEGEVIVSISHVDVGENLRRIMISGRLDLPGTDSVAAQLEELAAAPKKGVLVDLSSVKFLASIGIRALITSGKAVQKRGGKMVLVVNEDTTVMMSLKATGVDVLIPVFSSSAEAERAALA